jgi:hypothetical protein
MSLKDDLIAARALIDTPEKWRKDAYSHDPNSCCAMIAANRTQGLTSPYYPAAHKLVEAIPEEWMVANEARISSSHRYSTGQVPGLYVGEYNDDPATTHADILALYDRAIEAAS